MQPQQKTISVQSPGLENVFYNFLIFGYSPDSRVWKDQVRHSRLMVSLALIKKSEFIFIGNRSNVENLEIGLRQPQLTVEENLGYRPKELTHSLNMG